MGLHLRIVAAFSSHDAFARVAEGVVRLRDGCDVGATVEPASTVRELVSADVGTSNVLVATDVLTPPCCDGPSLSRRIGSLEALRQSRQELPVVACLGRWRPSLVRMLRGMGIREVVLGEEDTTPGAIGEMLGQVLLPHPAARFLAAMPEQLRPRLRLALTRGVMNPRATWEEEDLARWAVVDVDRLRADFRRSGVGSAGEWCLWGHLYQVAERMERHGGSLEGAARGLGIPDRAAFLEACRPLIGEERAAVLSGGGGPEVLCAMERWCRSPGSEPRGSDEATGGETGQEAVRPTASPPAESTLSEEAADRLAELYEAFRDDVWHGAKRGGASDEEAEDIVQEVFLGLAAKSAALQDRGFSRAYFRRAGRNRAADRAKAAHTRTRSLDYVSEQELGQVPSLAPGVVERSHRQQAVRDAIRRLPEPGRSVVRLCGLEGWKGRQVAGLLGKTEKSIEHRRRRAKREIERAVGPRPPR